MIRVLKQFDLNSNPMKPITKKNLGKKLDKDHNRYRPHIGAKQKSKGKRT